MHLWDMTRSYGMCDVTCSYGMHQIYGGRDSFMCDSRVYVVVHMGCDDFMGNVTHLCVTHSFTL